MEIGREDITKFEICMDFNSNIEIRAMKNKTMSRIWVPKEAFVEEVVRQNKYYKDVFVGINDRKNRGSKNNDVTHLNAIVIDIDTIREKGKQPTEQAMNDANNIVEKIMSYCKIEKLNMPIVSFTGNGFHVYFFPEKIKINESNREYIKAKVKDFVKKFTEYDLPLAYVDVAVSDLARVIRVPGTISFKNDTPIETYWINYRDFKGRDKNLTEFFLKGEYIEN